MKKIIRRLVYTLMFLLLAFALLFGIGIWAFQNDISIFGIGLPPEIENGLTIFLSFLGVVMVIYELARIKY